MRCPLLVDTYDSEADVREVAEQQNNTNNVKCHFQFFKLLMRKHAGSPLCLHRGCLNRLSEGVQGCVKLSRGTAYSKTRILRCGVI